MKGNPIINKRIEHFTKRKEALLKMKKTERRDELKTVDDTIARLKRWNLELETKKRIQMVRKNIGNITVNTDNCNKSIVGAMNLINGVRETIEMMHNPGKQLDVNPMKYN